MMYMPHPPIILFDFDGVVITHTSLELAALRQVKNKWYKWQNIENMRPIDYVRILEQSDSKNKVKAYRNLLRNYKSIIPNYLKIIIFFLRFRFSFPKLEKNYETLKPNLENILKILKDNNIPTGIVSNTQKKRLSYFTEKFNLNQYFDVLMSRSDAPIRKPHPVPILIALKSIKNIFSFPKIEKNRVYFIGDLPTDILCAKNAGVNSIAILSGHGLKKDLESENPTFIIKNIKKLLEIEPIKKYLNK